VKLDTPDSQEKTESILRCIDYSHSNLSPEAQQLLLCLAPFTSVIWLNMLDRYTEQLRQQPALAALPFEHWPEVIQEAQNWGLLSPDPATPNFARLQPIFPYFLRSRLQEPVQAERKQAVERAFREYYQRLGASLDNWLTSQDAREQQGGQLLTGLEYENLVTALTLALAAETSIAGYYEALLRYLTARQDPRRGLALFQAILDRFERYPAEKLAGPLGVEFINLLGSTANWQLDLKQYAAAETSYQKILRLVPQLAQLDQEVAHRMQAKTYHHLGIVAQEQHQLEQAGQYYQQALEIYIEFNDRYSQADTYHELGMVAQKQRQFARAEHYYQQALQLDIESNDRYNRAKTYHNLGVVAQEQWQWLQAEQHYQQALQLYIEYNDRYNRAKTYHNLGVVAQQQRQFEQAAQYLQQALQLKIEFNDRYSQASTYQVLGMVAEKQRQWAQAAQYLQQALQIYEEYNDRHSQASTYHNLGIVAQEQRQWEQAEQYYQQALQIDIEYNNRYSQASTYQGLGAVAQEQGQWEQAAQYYQQALQLKIEFNDRHEGARIYYNLGILEREREQWAQAREYLLRALEIFVDYQDDEGVDATLYSLARLWQSSHDAELPAAIAPILGASREEIEEILRKSLE
jgi:tetratricopeptide (TPR) repeat protein